MGVGGAAEVTEVARECEIENAEALGAGERLGGQAEGEPRVLWSSSSLLGSVRVRDAVAKLTLVFGHHTSMHQRAPGLGRSMHDVLFGLYGMDGTDM